MRLIWSSARGVALGGTGGLPRGFLPVLGRLLFACLHFGAELGLLFLVTGFRSLFDLRLGRRDGLELIFPAGDLGRDAQAFGQLTLVGRFGQDQQFLDFLLELDFQLLGMPIRQGAVPGGVGVYLGAVEADIAESAQAVGLGNLQNLHEEGLELFTEASPEGGQGVVVGVAVAGEIAEGDRVVGGHLDAAAGEYASGVAIDQQTHQTGGVVGVAATSAIGPLNGAEVQAFDDVGNVARQVGFRQPVLDRGREKVFAVSVNRVKAGHGYLCGGNDAILAAWWGLSPTGC